ncbi:MAG TPA: SdpI family protein [Bacteroidia bacterium]|nr:SdpI family protein [Bacteroidia bacterium]
MNKHLKESILWILILLPYFYLATMWDQLPARVPTHFNFEGIADDWSSKTFLLFLPTGLGALIYLIMFALPYIDPKKKIQQMGEKYTSFRFILTIFFTLLSIYLLYASKEGGIKNPHLLIAILGIMFAMLGNYFQTVRPNYFIGIRTPWTLENETVWKKTHHLAGRLFMAGGILTIILSFIITNISVLAIVFTCLLIVMVLIPIIFSYTQFQKEKKLPNS